MEDKEEKIIKFIEDFGCCKEEQLKVLFYRKIRVFKTSNKLKCFT